MTRDQLTIRDAQTNQPWTVPYSPGVNLASQGHVPHIMASHCVLHGAKSLGKLAAVFEALDHSGAAYPTDTQVGIIRAMSADLMTIALRFANLYMFDLAAALQERVAEKNK